MTTTEFDQWQASLAEEYAAVRVSAGLWPSEGAVHRALESNAQILPQGLATPRMIIVCGIDAEGQPVGRAWVGLDHPRGAPDTAFLYDLEVVPLRRRAGIGRDLLAAVEQASREAGATALELNVFGGNRAAIDLYSAAGYTVSTQQMRKSL